MAEPSRGRPKKGDDERRDIRFQVRLSSAELEAIERAADGKPSTWARNVLLDAASKKKRGRGSGR